MQRTKWFRAAAGAVTAVASLGAASAAGASLPRQHQPARPAQPAPGARPVALQQELDAIRAAGATGVLAEVRTDGRARRATSGVADVGTGAPVVAEGYFRMGSNTKAFVAVVVLQLVGEGRLSLDDTVERWLPGVVQGNGNDGRRITVRQLLNHTSGLHDYTDEILAEAVSSPEAFRATQDITFDRHDLVARAVAHAPSSAPGQGFDYANTNYVLAGLIIEKVTGRPWAAEVRDRVVRPLGLRHTFAPGARQDLPEPHARGYSFFQPGQPIDSTTGSVTLFDAAGSLVTDVSDLTRFWRAVGTGALLRQPQAAELRRTVAAPELAEEAPGVRYGLGVEWRPLTCGGGYWGHGGDVPGYTTASGVSEDGRTTVVISMSTTALDELHTQAWTAVDHVLCGRA